MPIYMDRHDLPNITAQDVASAHQEDLKIQHEYGCRGLTYWFDEKRQTAFCLIEAPDEKAVKEMHNRAHGLVPHKIIEVDAGVVSAFLGRMEDPKPAGDIKQDEIPVINEPAFRIIMYLSLDPPHLPLTGKEGAELQDYVKDRRKFIEQQFQQHEGRLVERSGNSHIVSFLSVKSAVSCALNIHNKLQQMDKPESSLAVPVRIGLSGGPPFTVGDALFGESIELARRMSNVAYEGLILMSAEVWDLYREEELYPGVPSGIKPLSPLDEKFLNLLADVIESAWNESGFNASEFGKRIGCSRAQLYRRMVHLTGQSPNEFISRDQVEESA